MQGSGFRVVVAASPQKKEANPASLRSAAPSKGRGGGWVRKGVYEKICSTASARRHFPITACMLISVVQ